MNPLPRILLVDDDDEITEMLGAYLQRYGMLTHTAHDGPSMRAALAHTATDLIVLDWMLPDTTGLALAAEVRETTQTPVIMLTARATAIDRIMGLEAGADDYLTKPFEPRELVARIQCVLRRSAAKSPDPTAANVAAASVVAFDGWELHRNRRQLRSPNGTVVPLSTAEFRLLNTFLNKPHALLSRHQLLDEARGRAVEQSDRSIDLLVSRLRSKLTPSTGTGTGTGTDTGAGPTIKTIRGGGYIFTVGQVAPSTAWATH